VVSFSFSEHFPKVEMLKTRTKPGFLTSLFGRGFIFVQYSHQRDAGPKTRTSLCGVRFFYARVFALVHFNQPNQRQAAAPKSRISSQWDSRFYFLFLSNAVPHWRDSNPRDRWTTKFMLEELAEPEYKASLSKMLLDQ
jgi:hypothetical protein